MMGNPRCHWVRDRLPLSVGDDLRGLDRRLVERHLIGCPQCRQHQAALGQALETLRTVAATHSDVARCPVALARPGAADPRVAPAESGADLRFPLPPRPRRFLASPEPLAGLRSESGPVAVATVGLGVRHRVATAEALILANSARWHRRPPCPGPR